MAENLDSAHFSVVWLAVTNRISVDPRGTRSGAFVARVSCSEQVRKGRAVIWCNNPCDSNIDIKVAAILSRDRPVKHVLTDG